MALRILIAAIIMQLSERGVLFVECCGIPHLAKNERDVGHPALVVRDKVKQKAMVGGLPILKP
jgi:hypothetical protein